MDKISGMLLIFFFAVLAYAFFSHAAQPRVQPLTYDQTMISPKISTPEQTNPEPNALPPASQTKPIEQAPAKATEVLTRCIFMASNTYQVPTEVVIGIMYVEGGHVGQEAGPNLNGTYDLGPMQVNSLWVPKLAQLWHVDNRTAHNWLRDNGCENIYVGAWILKQKIAEAGTLYNGIAYYHSAARRPGKNYANKVLTAMDHEGFNSQEQ